MVGELPKILKYQQFTMQKHHISILYMTNTLHAELRTDGEHVGLPEGQMGNSEVGHMNLGAGRIVYQNLSENQ